LQAAVYRRLRHGGPGAVPSPPPAAPPLPTLRRRRGGSRPVAEGARPCQSSSLQQAHRNESSRVWDVSREGDSTKPLWAACSQRSVTLTAKLFPGETLELEAFKARLDVALGSLV